MNLRESLFQNSDFTFKNHLFYQKHLPANTAFEEAYLKIRANENRIYTDDQVKKLPDIDYTHPLKREWQLRKKSMYRLIRHLRNQRINTILEIGCGNGWLSHHLSRLPNVQVLGVDINETELLQAAQVFKRSDNLTFVYADILSRPAFPPFDAIVLASSLQYFSHIASLMEVLLSMCTTNGAVHILDSPIYSDADVDGARARSQMYFAKHDSSMQRFYHHHRWADLGKLSHQIMYNPTGLRAKIRNVLSRDSPFPWIRITR